MQSLQGSNPKTYSDRVRFNENAARNAARTRSLNKSKNDLTNTVEAV